jgi:hypothetical protein
MGLTFLLHSVESWPGGDREMEAQAWCIGRHATTGKLIWPLPDGFRWVQRRGTSSPILGLEIIHWKSIQCGTFSGSDVCSCGGGGAVHWFKGNVHIYTCSYTVKKGYRFSRPQRGCHWPNSPWPGMIRLFPARERLVSDILAGAWKIANLFFTVYYYMYVLWGYISFWMWKAHVKTVDFSFKDCLSKR